MRYKRDEQSIDEPHYLFLFNDLLLIARPAQRDVHPLVLMLDLINVWFLGTYATRPIHVFGTLGLGSAALGILVGMYLTFLKIFTGASIGNRPLLMLAVLLVVIGVQLVTTGLLGEMVTRTYYESQNKTIYIVREVVDHRPADLVAGG